MSLTATRVAQSALPQSPQTRDFGLGNSAGFAASRACRLRALASLFVSSRADQLSRAIHKT